MHPRLRSPFAVLRRLVLATGVLAALPWGSSGAQLVRGELVVRGAGSPIRHAFVVLRDSAGVELARARTDPLGRFALQAPGPGKYRLHTAIIGARSHASPLIALADDQTLTYRMEVALIPVRLSAVTVTGERRCRVTPEAGAEVAQVWEEARKALAAVSWSQQSDSLRYRVILYTRQLNPGSLRPIGGRATQASGIALGSPFGSAPAAELAERGYIRQREGGAWQHFGPDADVLLSETFASGHCFYLRAHPDDERLLGLAFEPVRQGDLPDVEGVLWLDKETARLTHLDFEYARLPWPVDARHAGGHVEFEQLPTGPWIVRHWWLRMPLLVQWHPIRRPRIVGFHETGGLVTEFRHGGRVPAIAESDSEAVAPGTEWRVADDASPPAPPSLRGVVAVLGSGAPVPHATLLLLGPADSVHALALSTSRGWFEIIAPDSGRFRMVVSRAGYHVVSSEPLEVVPGRAVELRVNLRSLVEAGDSTAADTPSPPPESRLLAAVRRRRTSGITLFGFDRGEIAARRPASLLQLVAEVRGVYVVGPPGQYQVVLNRRRCAPAVYIDGYPAVGWRALALLPVQWVAAVEVFRTAEETPALSGSPDEPASECGTVFVWTIGAP